jgi:hypothetical protein
MANGETYTRIEPGSALEPLGIDWTESFIDDMSLAGSRDVDGACTLFPHHLAQPVLLVPTRHVGNTHIEGYNLLVLLPDSEATARRGLWSASMRSNLEGGGEIDTRHSVVSSTEQVEAGIRSIFI